MVPLDPNEFVIKVRDRNRFCSLHISGESIAMLIRENFDLYLTAIKSYGLMLQFDTQRILTIICKQNGRLILCKY